MFKRSKKKAKNNIAIYSCIIGDIDNLIVPKFGIPGCDLILFTDRKDIQSDKFQIREWKDIYKNQRLSSRAPKLLPHFFLPEYEYSMWIDGRVVLREENLADFIRDSLKDANWAAYAHPERDNIFDEAEICIDQGKDDKEKINKQIDRYRKEGFENQVGLFANTVLLRKHNELDVIKFNELWWREIQEESIRDQLSFPYLAWKQNLKIKKIDGFIRKNKFLRILRYSQRDAYKEGEYNIEEAAKE